MEFTENQINDVITSAIIRTLKIIKSSLDDGDDLNTIDYEYLIQCRMRDLNNPEILEQMTVTDNRENFV